MTTERESINLIQDALRVIKGELKNIQDVNTKADRLEAANAAYGYRGDFISLHAKMTRGMHKYFPEFAAEVQTRGPGGR